MSTSNVQQQPEINLFLRQPFGPGHPLYNESRGVLPALDNMIGRVIVGCARLEAWRRGGDDAMLQAVRDVAGRRLEQGKRENALYDQIGRLGLHSVFADDKKDRARYERERIEARLDLHTAIAGRLTERRIKVEESGLVFVGLRSRLRDLRIQRQQDKIASLPKVA